jgi:opacity protein-like surface antigen
MKKILTIVLFAASLTTSAQAVIIGLESSYLLGSEETGFSARLGYDMKTAASLSHQLEIEVGYFKHSYSAGRGLFKQTSLLGLGGAETKIVPLTLNYRLAVQGTQKIGYYFGAGIGMARTSVWIPANSSPSGLSDDDSSVMFQGFTGVTYQVASVTSLYAGLKYLWIGNVTAFGRSVKMGGDAAITAGISCKF